MGPRFCFFILPIILEFEFEFDALKEQSYTTAPQPPPPLPPTTPVPSFLPIPSHIYYDDLTRLLVLVGNFEERILFL